VSIAGYEAGYGSVRALYEKSLGGLGMTPATYQRGAVGIGIRYALGQVVFGRVLVADTRTGVCIVLLGARDDFLLHQLAREFPGAHFSRNTRMPSPWLQVLRCAQREDPLLRRLPLTIRRDVFQAKVWKMLAPA
jgi:AraC family transcriptional regulator of adaptative response/methylated-DNA-[protein]-cysteine methyltransferase